MAAAVMYVKVTSAGTGDGSNWANCFGYLEWEHDVEAHAETGDVYYVAGGTYTLTSDFITALDGITTKPISIIGVNSGTTAEPPTVADYALADNRPVVTDAGSAYVFDIDDYWVVKNMKFTLSDTTSLTLGLDTTAENCYASNDGVATRSAIFTAGGITINCEATSTNGKGISLGGLGRCLLNYIHDSVIGIDGTTGDNDVITFNILANCSTGINFGVTAQRNTIIFNTIYNNDKTETGSYGILSGTTNYGWCVSHNIITGFQQGFVFGDTASNIGYFDYNNYYDCGTDRVNVPVGDHDMDVNPAFTTPGSNFSLQSTSACINTGITLLGTT